MVDVLRGNVTSSEFTMSITLNCRSSALILPFSWPWSYFACSTSRALAILEIDSTVKF